MSILINKALENITEINNLEYKLYVLNQEYDSRYNNMSSTITKIGVLFSLFTSMTLLLVAFFNFKILQNDYLFIMNMIIGSCLIFVLWMIKHKTKETIKKDTLLYAMFTYLIGVIPLAGLLCYMFDYEYTILCLDKKKFKNLQQLESKKIEKCLLEKEKLLKKQNEIYEKISQQNNEIDLFLELKSDKKTFIALKDHFEIFLREKNVEKNIFELQKEKNNICIIYNE